MTDRFLVARARRVLAAAAGFAFAFGAFVELTPPPARAAGTPAGTAITNQATVTYTDGNANSFTSTSNTVTTTVQNAPVITVVGTNLVTSVPGGQYDANFTVANTGNGTGTFTLTFGSDTGSDAANATQLGYQVTFPSTVTVGTVPTGCTTTATRVVECSSAANLQTLLNATLIPANAAITIAVPTSVAQTAAAGAANAQTIVTPLSGTVTYATANNPNTASNATSSASASTSTASILTEARLDVSKAFIAPGATGNATANLEYVINAANGGVAPARNLASVQTLLGGSAPQGILITDRVPTFNATPLVVQSAAATTPGSLVQTGASASIYYTSSATGAGPWTAYSSGAFPAGTTFVGVLVSGSATGSEINGNGGTTSTGNVTTSNAQVVITLYVTPPSGTGSGNANAVVNQADSVIGGNDPNTVPVSGVTNAPLNDVGPNITAGTADGVSTIDSGTQGILYPTQTAGTASSQSGASNAVGSQATSSAIVFVGPYALPEATGSYNGTATASSNNDFTAVAYLPSGFVPTNTSATAVVGNAVGATSTVSVPNSIQNTGNATDNLTVSIAAPAGWGVQIYAAGTGGAPTGPVLAGSATSNTASYTFGTVPSGAPTDTANVMNYAVTYTLPSTVTAFTPYDIVNTVTSGNAPSATNTTHNDLVPGGPLAIVKSQALDSGTCTGGVAVPGCIVTYTLQYVNNAEAVSACPGTAPTTVPANAGGYYVKGATISENGATAPSTWGTTYVNALGVTTKVTGGLNAPATETSTIPTSFPTGNAAGSYAFTALIGGSSTYLLAPGCTGSVRFSVTISSS